MGGLTRQYARTLGAIRAGQDQADDLVHLAAVIRMFDPDADLAAIKPVRPYTHHGRRDGRQWSRMALDALRVTAAPLTTREIAKRVARAYGVPDSGPSLFSIECSLHATLPKRACVRMVVGEPKRWRVV